MDVQGVPLFNCQNRCLASIPSKSGTGMNKNADGGTSPVPE